MAVELAESPKVEDLRKFEVFADLADEDLQWLASQMSILQAHPGDVLAWEGSPALYMICVVEGELRARSERGTEEGRVFYLRPGQISGMLPYSRLTVFPLTSRAVLASRIALLHKDRFPDVLDKLPELRPRLIALMADRIREVSRIDSQREKLAALGKISAGLAHELNNPAAAAQRASVSLKQAVEAAQEANLRLDELSLSAEERAFIACIEREVSSDPQAGLVLDSLERSDQEERVSAWLKQRNVQRHWELAPGLVEAGFSAACLDEVSKHLPAEALSQALVRMTAAVTVNRLVYEIEESTCRITEIVKAVKEYSYMDQMPEQEINIHDGLESTLVMLRHRLKHGIAIVRDYDKTLPRVCARGRELNQVWTSLIENALDAMRGDGELRIRTGRELEGLQVEIIDNGPGIPPEISNRIFEPFFTTKGVGEGMGLGLDTAYRIVLSHHGDIHFESQPGNTRFWVWLPAVK